LQAGAEEFDARGAERIAFEQGDLQLALAGGVWRTTTLMGSSL
jgi:hypothetical protein